MPKSSKKIKTTTKKPVISRRPVVVAVSGFFNPLHVGHLEMIAKAKKLGDKLVVIVNNDKQVRLKNRVPFMSEADRMKIVAALRDVDKVVLAIDDYKLANGEIPVIKSLAKVHPDIFANGGDRHSVNDVPEHDICQKLHIKMVDGLGKKIRASSELIANAKKYEAELRAAKLQSTPLPVKSVSAKPARHSCGCCQ